MNIALYAIKYGASQEQMDKLYASLAKLKSINNVVLLEAPNGLLSREQQERKVRTEQELVTQMRERNHALGEKAYANLDDFLAHEDPVFKKEYGELCTQEAQIRDALKLKFSKEGNTLFVPEGTTSRGALDGLVVTCVTGKHVIKEDYDTNLAASADVLVVDRKVKGVFDETPYNRTLEVMGREYVSQAGMIVTPAQVRQEAAKLVGIGQTAILNLGAWIDGSTEKDTLVVVAYDKGIAAKERYVLGRDGIVWVSGVDAHGPYTDAPRIVTLEGFKKGKKESPQPVDAVKDVTVVEPKNPAAKSPARKQEPPTRQAGVYTAAKPHQIAISVCGNAINAYGNVSYVVGSLCGKEIKDPAGLVQKIVDAMKGKAVEAKPAAPKAKKPAKKDKKK